MSVSEISKIDIQFVPAEAIYSLRHKVLRPHQTLNDCIYPADAWANTFHLAAKINGQIVGIATFHEEESSDLKADLPYRLRGMATDFSFHQQGIGRKVLESGMQELKRRNCDLLWFYAREIAFPFYEKLGFSYLGPLFDIPGIGPHKTMYKYFG